MNNQYYPHYSHFVVEGGDFIEGTNREGQRSIDDFIALKKIYDELVVPHYHVLGNHAVCGFNKEKWLDLIENESTFCSFGFNENLRIYVLDGDFKSVKKCSS